jgi:hypothetical protein
MTTDDAVEMEVFALADLVQAPHRHVQWRGEVEFDDIGRPAHLLGMVENRCDSARHGRTPQVRREWATLAGPAFTRGHGYPRGVSLSA